MYRILLIFLLVGCTVTEDVDKKKQRKFATGKVLFVVNDDLWTQKASGIVLEIFNEDIEGIPQSIPKLIIQQTNQKKLNQALKTNHGIIGVVFISEGKKIEINTKNNEDMLISTMLWDGDISNLEKKLLDLRTRFIKQELKVVKEYISRGSNKEIEKDIKEKFSVNLIAPPDYKIIKNTEDIFIANCDHSDSDQNKTILTYSFKPDSDSLQLEVMLKTDSIFSKYLKGEKENQFVRIEPNYTPVIIDNTVRGAWRLENDFIGGFFILKFYKVKDKVSVSAGVVFSPQTEKRKCVIEMMAIL